MPRVNRSLQLVLVATSVAFAGCESTEAPVRAIPATAIGATAPATLKNVGGYDAALDAFFDAIDRKSTALTVSESEPPPDVARPPEQSVVRDRIIARAARIDFLRARGIAGEDNRGFLDPRGTPSVADQGTISEENTDRLQVYGALAAQSYVRVDTVGRARAERVETRARRGVWVQGQDGTWRQKI